MSSSKFHSAIELALPASIARDAAPSSEAIQDEVLRLFDECAPQLRRYMASFGLDAGTTDDVVQEIFLSLFRHLRLGRSRSNLRGWLFQVGHNLALKERYRIIKRQRREHVFDGAISEAIADPGSSPEQQLADTERRRTFRAVVRALPERDRQCLYLRAEGFRYRDIAGTLGISLGSVAKSLTRAITRLANTEKR